MTSIFSIENLMTLCMLILLQVVLGLDNLLYISIESKRVVVEKQAFVRKMGIAIAVLFRLVLLFTIVGAIQYFQKPFLALHLKGIIEFEFNVHSFVVVLGGAFILYTALREIFHLLAIEELSAEGETENKDVSVKKTIILIVTMNLVFSFDSILAALALTDVFFIMALSVIAGGGIMIWLSDYVVVFIEKNRMYEVLGLFILFIVGIMLLSEGGHLAQLHFFGYIVEPMAKSTFYFVIGVLVLIDLVQSRYQKKLLAEEYSRTVQQTVS